MDIFINEAGDKAKCSIGILVMEDVQNISSEDMLMPVRQELEDTIRLKYGQATRAELKAIHPMDDYVTFYKNFYCRVLFKAIRERFNDYFLLNNAEFIS